MTVHSPEAEMALIGAALFSTSDTQEALDRLRPEHFGEPVLATAWAWIADTVRKGGRPDIIGLDAVLSPYDAYADLGGRQFLLELVDDANTWALPSWIDMILDRAARRSVAALCGEVAAQAKDMAQGSAEHILADLERGAAEIARTSGKVSEASPLGLGALDMLEAAWDGRYAGASVGLECLDRITGGIQQDHVWIVGARTSMGKSVLLPCLGRSLAEQGLGTMLFSLEMPKREVQARVIADIAFDRNATYDDGNVRFGDLLKGRGSNPLRERARAAAKAMAILPMTVVDKGGLTLDDIIVQALRQMRAWEKAGVKPGAVLIDHLGLVRSSKNRDSKAAETADTVDRLKEAAKQIGAPIIAAAQVNRNPEGRNDKRPTAADLNWSGSIEQIADLICLLYRPSYYLERSPSEDDQRDAVFQQNDLEIIVPKNRSGPTCTLHAYVDVACNAIRDKEERYPESYRGRG